MILVPGHVSDSPGRFLYMGVCHFLRTKEFYISILLNKLSMLLALFSLLSYIQNENICFTVSYTLITFLFILCRTVLVWRSEASIVEVIGLIPCLSHFYLFFMCMSELA